MISGRFICCLALLAVAAAVAEEAPAPAVSAVPELAAEKAPAPQTYSEDVLRKLQETSEIMRKDTEAAPHSPLGASIPEARASEMFRTADAEASKDDASQSQATSVFKAMAALCLVIALILALTVAVKKLGRKTGLGAASLAKPLGRVYLAPRTALHFVETGGKVLVIGATQNAISLLASFDAAEFHAYFEQEKPGAAGADNQFINQLRATLQDIKKNPKASEEGDRDLAALRNEVQRLQRNIQESAGGDKD